MLERETCYNIFNVLRSREKLHYYILRDLNFGREAGTKIANNVSFDDIRMRRRMCSFPINENSMGVTTSNFENFHAEG